MKHLARVVEYERHIRSFDETARVLARLNDPNRVVIETCIVTTDVDVDMTAECTFVAPERQNALTCRVQARLAKASKEASQQKKAANKAPAPTAPQASAAPNAPVLATRLIQ